MWSSMFLVYLVLLLTFTPVHAQGPTAPKAHNIFAEKEQALRAQEMRLREAMEEIKALEGAIRVTETSSTLQQEQLKQRGEAWRRRQQMMYQDPAISDEAERQAYARALQASQESQRALAALRQNLALAQSNKGTIEARLNSIRDAWEAAKADLRRFQAIQLRQQFERIQEVDVHGEVGCAGDSSIRECQRHALERALGLAAEQGSVVSVTTLSEVKNLQLTRDEIRTQVKALLLSHEIHDEGVVGRGSGYYYKVRARVRSQISDQLIQQLIGADPSYPITYGVVRGGIQYSVEPGEIWLTTMEQTGECLHQNRVGRLAQLTARVTKRQTSLYPAIAFVTISPVGALAPKYGKAQGAVKLSERIAPPAGLQNRACHFSGTRLLS
jgi:hypothetical protein